MDKIISKEEQRKERNRIILKYGIIGVAIVAVIVFISSMLGECIDKSMLTLSKVDEGTIDISLTASGRVVPAFEEVINSPIDSRIMEIYCKSGDSVDVGTSILKLDLLSVQTEYNKLLDEEQMKQYQLEQLKLNNETFLSDLSMKVKVSAMELNRMEVELKNERYLDSIGSGTTDKVRQAEFAYNTEKLKLEQLKQMYQNESKVRATDVKVKELELQIFSKSLAETKRMLEDAQIKSPRKATLTYINNQIGARVGKGEQVATIADLSRFKVNCEISDMYGNRVVVGHKAMLKVAGEKLSGSISNVTPMSQNGSISFTMQIDDDSNKILRSGLKANVYVFDSVKENVKRIASGSYYMGPGEYELFVVDDNELVKRKIQLGESNYEYVEVISGLEKDEQVVINDMSQYKNDDILKLN